MTVETRDVSTAKKGIIKNTDKGRNQLTKKIIRLSAIACNHTESDNFDLAKAEYEAEALLRALDAKGMLQEMLAAQMLSVHRLQQISTAHANESVNKDIRQYFSNTAIKLANTFVQQVNLYARLQGNGGQKIVVEHVEVHHGGQAVVGNIKQGGQ